MKKRIFLIFIVFFALCLFPQDVWAGKHWAEGVLQDFKSVYQIEIYTELDKPAGIELQNTIFDFLGIMAKPEENLSRYKLLFYLVEALPAEPLTDKECRELLRVFEDTCEYCTKANMVPGRAKKAGLLRGRLTAEGLFMALDAPVTQAELVVLANRFLEIKGKE